METFGVSSGDRNDLDTISEDGSACTSTKENVDLSVDDYDHNYVDTTCVDGFTSNSNFGVADSLGNQNIQTFQDVSITVKTYIAGTETQQDLPLANFGVTVIRMSEMIV